MVKNQRSARRSRSSRSRVAVGLLTAWLAIGLVPAGATEGDPPTAEEASPQVSPLEEAAADLRDRSVQALRGELSDEAAPLRVVLADLRTLASTSTAEQWAAASLAPTLREAAIGARRLDRRQILELGVALADIAPTPELERAMLRSSCRLAESLLHRDASASGGVDQLVQSPGTGQRIRRVLFGLHERLTALSLNGQGLFVQRSKARAAGLAPGVRTPRYVARDTAGNEIRSNDFLGKITLYRAWDVASPASVEAHRRDAELLRRHWDRPFELVGISDHEDREAHLASLPTMGFGGTQLYDGPISTELVDALAKAGGSSSTTASSALAAWLHPTPGTCILVDSRGVIRGRDLSHEELDELILELVDEHRLLLRQRRQGN